MEIADVKIQPGQVVQIDPAKAGVSLRPADYRTVRGLVMRTYRWAASGGKVLDVLWIDGTKETAAPAEYFLPID